MATFVIADDSRAQRLWIRQVLTAEGHNVLGDAPDGKRAIALCREHHPDFVTLDINMPEIPGSEAAKAIVSEQLAGHIIVFTLNSQEQIVDPLVALGCTVWKKPFSSKERFINLLEPLLTR